MWDWDGVTSRDDLIGFADVPLRGVLLSGRIYAALGMPVSSTQDAASKGGAKAEKRLMTAGTVEGSIEVVAEPAHTQFGDVVKRVPGMTYLAVNIQSCLNLVGKKSDGMSDPYLTAAWTATSQQTRVINSTLAPEYNETLYFPTNLVRFTAKELAEKGDLVLHVMHHAHPAPEDIGFCRITLDKVTSSPVKRIDDEGTNIKTRVFEARIALQQSGVMRKDRSRGEVNVRVYFTPDVPDDVKIAERRNEAHQLEEAYQKREEQWKALIPHRLMATGCYLSSALDETNTMRFLPTYLCKCAPPREYVPGDRTHRLSDAPAAADANAARPIDRCAASPTR